MVKAFRRPIVGLILPVVAFLFLVVLLIFALARLAQIQQDMRSNDNANMLWVLSQTQATTLRAQSALLAYRSGTATGQDVEQAFAMLDSRLELLRAGPQARVLDELDASGRLSRQVNQAAGESSVTDVSESRDGAHANQVLAALRALDQSLSRAANQAMVAQWESMGGRLDRYRDSVLTIIFIMIGICLCSLLIAASLFLALKRLREAEWLKRQSVHLRGQLEAERKLGELHRSFNAMISHQFRTPLAIIDTSMQRLQRSPPPLSIDFVRGHAAKARRAATRLARVVEHSLIAEQYTEGLEVRLRACSLWQIVATAISEETGLSSRVKIDLSPTTDTVAKVVCDPVLTEHIIANLLSNAIKYSGSGSPIEVRFSQTASHVFCEVIDQGMGIREQDIPRLFQRYFRTQEATSTEGTGMGLFVAHSLLVLQSGTLEVRSTLGKGSVFRAGFPRAHDHTETNHAS